MDAYGYPDRTFLNKKYVHMPIKAGRRKSITEHTIKTRRHTTFYLAAGPENGPLVIFLHGWPELSISWRHQLPALAALGFRTIAPDMRGYGRSSVYPQQGDYAQEHIVRDMLELVEAVGREKAVWVGHDWGSPVVWNLASHHPDRCHAVANLCVPYCTFERGLDHVLATIDRELYPENEFPAGQWDYMRYYEESFAEAIASMDANVYEFVKLTVSQGGSSRRGATSVHSNGSSESQLPRDESDSRPATRQRRGDRRRPEHLCRRARAERIFWAMLLVYES
jgi:pimeloyl-ACP methyl ester carboxylesterase